MREEALRPDAGGGAQRSADDDDRVSGGPQDRPRWKRWAGNAFGLALLGAVAWVIVDRARTIDWPAVWQALKAYPLTTLAAVLALVAIAHAVFASYELIAKRYLRHDIPKRKVMTVGLVCFAFNLNLGSWIGGYAFRWRLYQRLGLRPGQIGRLLAFNLVTNWSGYFALAGLLIATGLFKPPPPIELGEWLRLVGVALMAVPAAYVALAARSRRREWSFRGHEFALPSARLAAVQVAVSAVHWVVTGAIINLLLPAEIGFATVLGTLMSAAVVGAMLHVPGGLGVIEAVFIASLGGRLPEGQLVAALLAYRAAFYLLPLLTATVMHLTLEALARRRGAADH